MHQSNNVIPTSGPLKFKIFLINRIKLESEL